MATHYTKTSKTITVKDYYGSNWIQVSCTVTVAADGTVSYSATASNSGGTKAYKNNSFIMQIAGKTVCEGKYSSSTTAFPNLHGTTKADNSLTTTSAGSINITLKLCTMQDGNVGNRWTDGTATVKSETLTRNYWTDGTAPTCSISQTAGSNTITFSGKLGKSGTNNAMSSATLYYWMNGASSYSSHALTATSEGSWTVSKTATEDDEVWAYVTCAYPHGDKSCTAVSKQCYYYSAGGTPTCSISQSVGSNTVTISGNKGTNGSHNGKESCTLYYNRGTGESNQSVDLGTSGSTYSYDLEMGEGNNNKTVSAYVCTDYKYGDNKYGYATSITSKYYSSVTAGTVNIKDNGNNTFTLTGTKGSDGYNNAATGPTLSWGYDTNYSNSFKTGDTKSLTIVTPANATRTVYAKSVTGKTNYGSVKTATTSLAVKQYVAPSSPGNPTIAASSYKNGRLTVKKNWTFTWTAAGKANDSSPVKGYRIRVYKNGSLITGITAGTDSNISKGTGTNEWLDRTGATNCSIVFNPETFGFKPGDTVKVGVFAWTTNGAGSVLWSGSGNTQAISASYTVENAGVVRIKVGGSWKEGQVWIKTGGVWKEAVSVHAKVSGSWKEST